MSIVDDDPSVLSALARLLRSAGFVPSVFASGEEFLGMLPAEAPECMIIDINMPVLDGFALRERVSLAFPSMPIIFITAQEDAELDDRARAVASQFLRKPFRAEDLVHAIELATGGYGE